MVRSNSGPSGFHESLRDSAYDFSRVVWPVVKPWIDAEDVYPVEAVGGAAATIVDIFAGIDLWVLDETGLRGVASRVQYPQGNPYLSFTIRSRLPSGLPTELDKRLAAMGQPEAGYLFPIFTIQAYVTEPRTGELSYVCMVRTRDLFEFVRQNVKELRVRTNPQDGTEFLVVWVADLLGADYPIWQSPPWAQVEIDQAIEAEYEDAEEGEDEPHMMLCPNCWEQPVMSDWAYCPACGEYF